MRWMHALLLILMFAGLVRLVVLYFVAPASFDSSGAVFSVLLVCSAMVGSHFYLHIRPAEFAGAFLTAGRCPHCAYDLTPIKAESDGCHTCPECGSRWPCCARTQSI